MKISVAQTRPIKGDILANIINHKRFLDAAILNNVELIVFPELSLTGYEPELMKQLVDEFETVSLNDFQLISDRNNIIICLGLPTKSTAGVVISMAIFQPNMPIQIYSKQHLHPGEDKVFTVKHQPVMISKGRFKIAPAICYETSIAEHAADAYKSGANIYMASVLNSTSSIDKDMERLSKIASKYNMTTFMANYVGQSGGYECVGNSAVWNHSGVLIGQLDNQNEGLLLFDTETEVVQQINWN